MIEMNQANHGTPMCEESIEPTDFASLYRRAFEKFGSPALWGSRPVPNPTPADALAITRSLHACRAAL